MTMPPPLLQRTMLHGSAIAIDGKAVLLLGRSGSGKSDLALRLMDRGAILIADDQVVAQAEDGRLWLSAPARLAGLIELRGLGVHHSQYCARAPLLLGFDLDRPPERLPEIALRPISGIDVPLLPLAALEASAPIRVEWAVQMMRSRGLNGFDVDEPFRLSKRNV